METLDPTAPHAHGSWRQVHWSEYNLGVGETRPALCDVDGDGKDELVIGLGPFRSGGWLEIKDDAEAGYAHLAWIRVDWADYNRTNGETFPACGDLDGDGRDEIVVGLGPGGFGWFKAFDDAATGFAALPGTPNPGGWIRLQWSEYNNKNAAIHPAIGNLDNDAREELVLGLGPFPPSGGWVQVLDDATAGFGHLAWVRLGWADYNRANGETWPVVCNLKGEGRGELVLGLGSFPGSGGWVQVLDDATAGFGHLAWVRLNWTDYNTANGTVFPGCGDLDGDGRDELVFGLDSFAPSGGWVEVKEDLNSNLAHRSWARVFWKDYNETTGLTRPAVGSPGLDISGTYVGSGSLTQTNCLNPANNGTLGFLASVSISTQSGDTFSGTATLTDASGGSTNGSISGTVTVGGLLSGTFTFTTLVFGAFDSSGDGTFTGQVTGNTLSINFTGQDRVGDTCRLTGSLSATFASSIPDTRGTYGGSGTVTNSLCLNPANNGTSSSSVTLRITSQAGARFSGSGTQTFPSGNVNQITVSGTVTVGGQLSGTFAFTNSLGASGDGTFTGQVSGTVILHVIGQFRVGEACIFAGSLSATR